MVIKTINKQPKAIVDMEVTVPWADIAPKWDEILQKLSQDIELPGFRKGQAPLNMVEQQLGSKVQDEFLKIVMPQALVDALQGTDVVPIDYPKYQLISFTKGQPLIFKATITERPKVEVGDYKTISAQRPPIKTVTDEEVEKIVEDLYKRWSAKQSSVVSPQTSDQTVVSGNGSPSTPQASGSMSFNQPAASAAQPAADSSLIGPSDTFAQAMGTGSLADLKTKIKADLENEAKFNNELDFEEAILQEVEKITTVDVPQILIEDELNRMLVQLQRRVTEMGLLFDEYLKSQNETMDSLKAKWTPQAEKNVRMELGLAEIARREGVDITDPELQAEIDKIQDARLKTQFEQQEPRLHLRHSLRQIKTLDLLKKMVQTI
ncbi:MAG: Trigger factor [Candidatus Daviesbacteria bacterium GW2011_GWA1_41_61]|uniref:Trigger factor n=1 Tax=Candidatus Daviesbacteria bacterium GW2011_GWA2_40_9 TaxID=1618424 RepID=A0A0G0U2C2_9BACT|nr:MAG: trigger factor, trigger factor [Candidatus Daviesbacteria bacterium GW2011_GWC1_40_9]KKR83244.1 MAG: Trigger factor [Candidatus Daviesbacteria bacterium GW2011_GWA2_40_9]KKR93589.1 MAG: Trigger factor [Candidatus Daviesbacteria bacterium GW2011_GWB1_41_15]KKS14860.1 MAG: Trigger factor [Candidatus Daviesbacteria bacterium GW2011_GWA1_41_61]